MDSADLFRALYQNLNIVCAHAVTDNYNQWFTNSDRGRANCQ